MKTTINVNGKPVEIELTADQVAEIKSKSYHYTDIKNLQDALNYIGESVGSFNHRTQFDDDVQRAYKELEVIVLAVRQGNELGHNKGDRWYYPWFNSARSSSGFSYNDCRYVSSYSAVGSRLCVESAEKAAYLGKQFIDIYNRYINGNNLIGGSKEISFVVNQKTFSSYKDIKTFEDACLATGVDASAFDRANRHLPEDVYAYMQLRIISKALNGGEHMNYDDEDEYKYYPYFYAKGSSSGFSFDDFFYVNSYSSVGSRLTYKTSEIAKYAGTQFLDIYNKYIN